MVEKNILKELCSFDSVRDKVIIRMMNIERQQKIVDVGVHRVFLDLAAVYHIAIDVDDYCTGVILITDDMMDRWNITEDELYEIAMRNMDRDMEFSFKNVLYEMIALSSEIQGFEELTEDIIEVQRTEDSKKQMFSIVDKGRLNGAVAIMRNDLLDCFASQLNSDLIILPSSVHELICLRDYPGFDYEGIKKVVRSVNRDVVLPKDILSDNIYRYTRETGMVEIVN